MRKTWLIAVSLFALVLLGACGAATPTTTTAPVAPTKAPTMTPTRAPTGGAATTTAGTPAGGGGISGLTFSATLSGGAQVVPTPTTTSATGQATLQVSSDGTKVTYSITVQNLAGVTMAHIHVAPPGQAGPIAVWLYPNPGARAPIPSPTTEPFSGVLAQGSFTQADLVGPLQGKTLADLVNEIKAGNAYVNVHTVKYPNGEIQGRLKVA